MEDFENKKEEVVTCLTIRQISAWVYAFSKGNNIYDTIKIIYGAKYCQNEKEEIEKILSKYSNLIKDKRIDLNLPNGFLFSNCYPTKQLTEAVKSMHFSFTNSRHVLLTGEEGNGTTQLAIWFSEWYIKKYCDKEKENISDYIYYSYCTEQTSIYDLIGKQKPTNESGIGKTLIRWEDGFLVKGLLNGGVVILDNIDKCPATVLERLNSLLDKKYDNCNKQGKMKEQFIVNEKPKNNSIDIDENFRLICI